MDVKQIKWNQELIKNKIRLNKQLKMINSEIDKQQHNCNHISVCLGWDGQFQYRNTSFNICIFCHENDPKSKYIIDATDYKKELYGHGESEEAREKRLSDLQNLAISKLEETPDISEEVLVEQINSIITESKSKAKQIKL